jgi:hypothetical protein
VSRAKERGADSRFSTRGWGVNPGATEPVFVTGGDTDASYGTISAQQVEAMLDIDNPVSGTKMYAAVSIE